MGLKLLAIIFLDNIANKPKNRLVEEDTCLNKLFSIIFNWLFASNSVQNIASIIHYNINN